MRFGLAALALATLIGCGQAKQSEIAVSGKAAPMARSLGDEKSPAAAADAAPPAEAAPPKPDRQAQDAAAIAGVMLAYTYTYGVEVPAAQVVPVMRAHEKICSQAGTALCQVLGASTNANGEADVHSQLQLRAEPRWLADFRARLEGDAKAAGGKLTSSSVASEDLTRDIIDTEAHMRAQKTLRDRLQTLLASRPGKLSDLLEVERELARVQGEIDSTQSNLAVMKTRVAMSTLTLDYASAGAPVTDTTFAPIKDALVQFARVVAQGFAAMIVLIAMALPWALVGGLLVWLFLRWRRRRRAGAASAGATVKRAST